MSSKFRTPYDGVRYPVSQGFGDEKSLTVQSSREECDINLIVDRARRGIMPSPSDRVGQYLDLGFVPDYHGMLLQVRAAQDMFGDLPARVRERFSNDVGALLAFVSDPANYAEAVSLGLIEPRSGSGSSPPAAVQPQAGDEVPATV